jgi:CDP-diacylglycerol---serine O-phosphatidyltransferase
MRKRDLHSLPNIFTAANLISGAVAVFALITKFDYIVPYCIAFSLFCDFCDGAVARKMGIQSNIGKELDSLADVISFGLVPSFMLMRMFNSELELQFTLTGILLFILPLTIAVYSAFRLAKFNMETRDSEYFYGLNTPSNTIMILGVFLSYLSNHFGLKDLFHHNIFLLAPLVILINYLLISNTPMFSNKSIKKQFRGNLPFILLGIILVISVYLFNYLGISITILSYVFMSLLVLRWKIVKMPE